MNSNNQISNITNKPNQTSQNDEINLVDIYITFKRNRKLFFRVTVLSILITLLAAYSIYYLNPKNSLPPTNVDLKINKETFFTEYVLKLDVGRIYGQVPGRILIEDPGKTIKKLNDIFIPRAISKFISLEKPNINQSLISAKYILESDLLEIKIKESKQKLDYNKILILLSKYVLDDHNNGAIFNNNEVIYKPTKIVEFPRKRVVKIMPKNQKKPKVNITVFITIGLFLSMFFGLFAILIQEFLNKVKETEALN